MVLRSADVWFLDKHSGVEGRGLLALGLILLCNDQYTGGRDGGGVTHFRYLLYSKNVL